jgi:cytidylate kinase
MPQPIDKKLLIAIDGPSASGKGTLAQLIADRLKIDFFPTGNMYRAVAKKILDERIAIDDIKNILMASQSIQLKDLINSSLNTDEIAITASIIAKLPEVRTALYNFQRNFIESTEGAVIEGRDIGTVICPEAKYKFFITANVKTRAERRFKELQNKGFQVIYNDILKNLEERDKSDTTREIAPLKVAENSIVIDTTELGIEEALEKILSYIRLSE